MKNETKIIIAFTIYIFIMGGILSCNAQTTISHLGLSELIDSDDEVECFAHYYDTKPEIIKANLSKYRKKYKKEIEKHHWAIIKPDDQLFQEKIPFTANGKMLSYKQFKKALYIDNETLEKRTYHYPVP